MLAARRIKMYIFDQKAKTGDKPRYDKITKSYRYLGGCEKKSLVEKVKNEE